MSDPDQARDDVDARPGWDLTHDEAIRLALLMLGDEAARHE